MCTYIYIYIWPRISKKMEVSSKRNKELEIKYNLSLEECLSVLG